ncbi:MAG: ATP synthase F1 subunit gamma [Tissierellia bacterium]|nr:ATP synthase F1 subunit gamma [Tissierellia bacterium]
MTSASDLKGRIDGIADIEKLTKAMYLIASTKVTRARAERDRTQPFFDAIEKEIKRAFERLEDLDSPYYLSPDSQDQRSGPSAIFVISSDRGLAGAYNHNIMKKVQTLLGQVGESRLFILGTYGQRYGRRHRLPLEEDFNYRAQEPSLDLARDLASGFLEKYQAGQIKDIWIVYTDFQNQLSREVKLVRALPFSSGLFKDPLDSQEDFVFLGSPEKVVSQVIGSYLTGFIYGALVDSFCSEQSARMDAMSTAQQNAQAMLEDLTLAYNQLRQETITQEITEITAGAKAQKKKRRR